MAPGALLSLMPGKTRDCTLAQNIMFKYKLVGFEFYEAMHKELSLLLTPAINDTDTTVYNDNDTYSTLWHPASGRQFMFP